MPGRSTARSPDSGPTRNEPVASAAPELSLTCTRTVYCPLIDGQPEITPQLLIARPRGSPDALNRNVQPGRPSVAGTRYRTGAPTEPVRFDSLPSATLPWTSHANRWVTLGSPAADAVTATGNGAADPGSCPLTAPVLGVELNTGRQAGLAVGDRGAAIERVELETDVSRVGSLRLAGAASSSAVLLSQLASVATGTPGGFALSVYCQ